MNHSQCDSFILQGLKTAYLELGSHAFKIILDSKKYSSSHDCEIEMIDSKGRRIKCEANKWGRKINCEFDIDESVSDGVSMLKLLLVDDENKKISKSYHVWIVKP